VPADNFHFFVLKVFVDLEEVGDFFDRVVADVGVVLAVAEAGVVAGDAKNFLVRALLVAHFHHSDGPRLDVAAGESGVVDHDEDVEGVAVNVVRAGDEAVVERVEKRRIEHPVEPEQVGGRVVLVFVGGPPRNFDDGVHFVRGVWSDWGFEQRHGIENEGTSSGRVPGAAGPRSVPRSFAASRERPLPRPRRAVD